MSESYVVSRKLKEGKLLKKACGTFENFEIGFSLSRVEDSEVAKIDRMIRGFRVEADH